VSAVLFRNSLPYLAFRKAVTEDVALLSPMMRVELIDVFTRPKFDRYLSRPKRLAFVGQYFQLSIPVYPAVAVTDCRDRKITASWNVLLQQMLTSSEAEISTCLNFIRGAAFRSFRPPTISR
jgi:predicted nucleic acid-binding protein